MVFTPRWRRIVASAAASATLLTSVALTALPAQADTVPSTGTPTTVSSDALPAPQVNGVVWSQVVVGNTVYVGGNFTQAQPSGAAAGVGTVSRSAMLAYNLTTGALITTFAPSFNAQVRGLAASPDGSTIYAVGDFTTVSGTSHSRIVALAASNGAVRPGFTASANSSVLGVATSGSAVYFGGSFTTVDGVSRTRAAAVDATSGAVTTFAPVIPDYTVRALVVSPDGSKVVLGGSFTSLNGSTSPGQGLGAVDSATGTANQTWNVGRTIYNHGKNSAIWSLSSDGTNVYGTGYVFGSLTDGNLEGTFNASWADGSINWLEDCHGDSYSVAPLGDAVYTVSHAHFCGDVPNGFAQTDPDPSKATKQHALAFSKATTGTLAHDPYGAPYADFGGQPAPSLLTWYPDLAIGSFTGQSQAAWSVTTAATGTAGSGYVLLGGEFPTVNGQRQVGLARFATKDIAPDKDGPRLSGTDFSSGTNWKATAVSLAAGTARVSWPANWDRDNANLTYTVKRGGTAVYTTTAESEGFWLRPTLGFKDTGLTPGSTVSYTVTATDPYGNSATSAAGSTVVSSGTGTSAYSNDVLKDGASDYWRFGEASGPTVYDWSGYSDLAAGTGVTFGAPGAVQNDSSTAATFSGDSTGLAATQTAVPGPNTFSVETWFNTTSTTGGKIVGFGNANTGTSSSYDRHVYMDGNGTVYFGVYPGFSATVQSTPGYNDGKWHQVVASLSSAGMQLFLDGKKVGARTDVKTAQAYDGYWRIGGDSSWSGSNFFTGSIDDTAIYPTALSATAVRNHYADAGYGTATTAPTDAYGKQVFGDGPDTYWRLGDASGSATAADASGNGTTGNVNGGVGFGAAGGIAGTSDTAATFNGTDGLIVSSQSQYDPEVYSLQLWFRTTTTTGGVLIGFGDQTTGESNNYDRHVLMRDDGRLEYGIWTGQPTTVTSSAAYNDGRWHQMVATQGGDGLTLYVDGKSVGNNPTSSAQAYSGYWRLGGDHAWGGNSSDFFAGTMDEVSVSSSELTAGQVANDYQLGAAAASNTPPVAAFAATPSNLSVALDASDSSDADGHVTSYAWDFGDGSKAETDTTSTTSHTYAAAGTYTVSLTVTDDGGATNTVAKQVTVAAANQAPTAAFSSNVTGLGVALDATASTDKDGTVRSYQWDFGDGATETDTTATTTHTYAKGGDYSVHLTATDDGGLTDSVTHTVSAASPNQAPVSTFTTTASGLTVKVDGSGSTDADGSVASWAWDFGDGATATGATASHDYAAGGTYVVQLTVKDDGGASSATTKSVTVTAPSSSTLASDAFNRTVSNGLGTADLGGPWTTSSTASDYSVAPGAAQLATAAGSTRSAYVGSVSSTPSDVVTTISLPGLPVGGTSYAGVVGRRIGSDDYNARILVAASGAVTVQTVRDGTALKSATVSGITYTAGLPLKLRLQTTGTNPTTVQARVWKASDSEPGTWQVSSTDSTAVLQAPGSVGLRSYLSSGVTSGKTTFSFSAFSAQTVGAPAQNAAPTASFTATTNGLAASVDGAGSSDSDGSIGSYAWDFGDGGTASGATASHTYAAGGTFTVTLQVTDDKGAKSSATKQVTVTAPPVSSHLATDAFGRTVATGFGTADVGGAWTVSGSAANWSVSNGAGTVSTAKGTTLSAYLNAVSSNASDVSVSLRIPALPAGGSIYAGVVGRRVGTDDYNARVIVAASGSVSIQVLHGGTALKSATVSGLTASAGSVIHLRMQTTGSGTSTLQARAWLDGATQPGSWQVSATDTTAALQAAGSVGVRTYVSSGLTNGPIAIGVDDFTADPAN